MYHHSSSASQLTILAFCTKYQGVNTDHTHTGMVIMKKEYGILCIAYSWLIAEGPYSDIIYAIIVGCEYAYIHRRNISFFGNLKIQVYCSHIYLAHHHMVLVN